MSPDQAAAVDALLDYYRERTEPNDSCTTEDSVTVLWQSTPSPVGWLPPKTEPRVRSTTETFVDASCGAPRHGRDFLVGSAAAGSPCIAFDRIKPAKRSGRD